MDKNTTATGALLGGLAIIFGAFGAHALKTRLTPELLNAFETGVRYQMYNALFLILLGRLDVIGAAAKKNIYRLVVSGTVLFSGSIYFLALQSLANLELKFIGIVTPFGGLLMIVGWFWLFFELMRRKS